MASIHNCCKTNHDRVENTLRAVAHDTLSELCLWSGNVLVVFVDHDPETSEEWVEGWHEYGKHGGSICVIYVPNEGTANDQKMIELVRHEIHHAYWALHPDVNLYWKQHDQIPEEIAADKFAKEKLD